MSVNPFLESVGYQAPTAQAASAPQGDNVAANPFLSSVGYQSPIAQPAPSPGGMQPKPLPGGLIGYGSQDQGTIPKFDPFGGGPSPYGGKVSVTPNAEPGWHTGTWMDSALGGSSQAAPAGGGITHLGELLGAVPGFVQAPATPGAFGGGGPTPQMAQEFKIQKEFAAGEHLVQQAIGNMPVQPQDRLAFVHEAAVRLLSGQHPQDIQADIADRATTKIIQQQGLQTGLAEAFRQEAAQKLAPAASALVDVTNPLLSGLAKGAPNSVPGQIAQGALGFGKGLANLPNLAQPFTDPVGTAKGLVSSNIDAFSPSSQMPLSQRVETWLTDLGLIVGMRHTVEGGIARFRGTMPDPLVDAGHNLAAGDIVGAEKAIANSPGMTPEAARAVIDHLEQQGLVNTGRLDAQGRPVMRVPGEMSRREAQGEPNAIPKQSTATLPGVTETGGGQGVRGQNAEVPVQEAAGQGGAQAGAKEQIEPITVYHGTTSNFLEFRPQGGIGASILDALGPHFGTERAATDRLLKYYDVKDASGLPDTSQVIEAQLRPQRPYLSSDGTPFTEGELRQRIVQLARSAGETKASGTSVAGYGMNPTAALAAKKLLVQQGYDSIPYINPVEDPGHTSWIALDPSIVEANQSRMLKTGEVRDIASERVAQANAAQQRQALLRGSFEDFLANDLKGWEDDFAKWPKSTQDSYIEGQRFNYERERAKEGQSAQVEPPPGTVVTVNGRTFRLTDDAEAQYKKLTDAHNQWVENQKAAVAKGYLDNQTAQGNIKAAGMQLSANLRELTGALTGKEEGALAKKEQQFGSGRTVSTTLPDGTTLSGTVVGNAFGKVRVQLGDGTIKSFDPADLTLHPSTPKARPGVEEILPKQNVSQETIPITPEHIEAAAKELGLSPHDTANTAAYYNIDAEDIKPRPQAESTGRVPQQRGGGTGPTERNVPEGGVSETAGTGRASGEAKPGTEPRPVPGPESKPTVNSESAGRGNAGGTAGVENTALARAYEDVERQARGEEPTAPQGVAQKAILDEGKRQLDAHGGGQSIQSAIDASNAAGKPLTREQGAEMLAYKVQLRNDLDNLAAAKKDASGNPIALAAHAASEAQILKNLDSISQAAQLLRGKEGFHGLGQLLQTAAQKDYTLGAYQGGTPSASRLKSEITEDAARAGNGEIPQQFKKLITEHAAQMADIRQQLAEARTRLDDALKAQAAKSSASSSGTSRAASKPSDVVKMRRALSLDPEPTALAGKGGKQTGALNIPSPKVVGNALTDMARGIAKEYVKQGATGLNDVLNRFQKDFPELDRDHVIDLLDGKYADTRKTLTAQQEKIQQTMRQIRAEAARQNMTRGQKIMDNFGKAANTIRGIKLLGHGSAPFVQGRGMFVADNAAWRSAVKSMAEGYAKGDAGNAMLAIKNHPLYEQAQKDGLGFTDPHGGFTQQEEETAGFLARNVPGLEKLAGVGKVAGEAINRSNISFANFMNTIRWQAYLNDVKIAPKDPAFRADIARAINTFSGRSTSNFAKAMQNPISENLMLSPRLTASKIDYARGQPLTGLESGLFSRAGTHIAYKYYAKPIASYGAASMALMYFGKQLGWNVDMDPRSPTFGRAQMGGVTFTMLPKEETELTKLFFQSVFGKTDAKGKVPGPSQDNFYNVVGNYVRNKLAPLPAGATDVVTGQTATGETGVKGVAKDVLLPIAVEGPLESYGPHKVGSKTEPGAGAAAAGNAFGLDIRGGQNAPPAKMGLGSEFQSILQNVGKTGKFALPKKSESQPVNADALVNAEYDRLGMKRGELRQKGYNPDDQSYSEPAGAYQKRISEIDATANEYLHNLLQSKRYQALSDKEKKAELKAVGQWRSQAAKNFYKQ